MAKKTGRRSARKAAGRQRPRTTARARATAPLRKTTRPRARKALSAHVPTRGLYGWITHTELASVDPTATKAWCEAVMGWTFRPSVPTPTGDYHLFAYSDQGGGGIRGVGPDESPGTTPFIHVEDAHAAFEKAVAEGADAVVPPRRVMDGVTVALVRAPGGVLIGFSGP